MSQERGPQAVIQERIDRSKIRFDRAIAFLTTSSVAEVKESALRVQEMKAQKELVVLYGDAAVINPPSTFQLVERASLGFNTPPVEGIHSIGDKQMTYLPTIFINMNSLNHIDISQLDTEQAIEEDAQVLAIDLADTNELAIAFGNGTYAGRVTQVAQRGLQNQANYLDSLNTSVGGNTDSRRARGDVARTRELVERRIGTIGFLTDMSLQDVQTAARGMLADLSGILGVITNFDMQAVERRLRAILLDPMQLQAERITEEDVRNHFLVLRARFQPMIMRQAMLTAAGVDMNRYITMDVTQKTQAEALGMVVFRQMSTEDRVSLSATNLIFGFISEFRE